MAGVNTSGWEHADWQEAATPAERLSGLVQHITEVRLAVVEQSSPEGRSQRINVTYLKMLQEDERRLRTVVGMSSQIDSSPVVLDPLF